ncbi:NUDIX hydrolase [Muriicola sp.]|uniref:NUDIX hydrolase n=1 Tax=Muriicola sp. TaxID=2020856 RepID=UPI003C734EAF
MIRKKKLSQPDKKTHPLIGVLLFLISVILLLITGPMGLIYGFFYTLFKGGLKGLGEYLLKIAVSIDQLGNVLMQHLLNLLWIRKGGYPFGNRDETISSALGRNKKLGMLTFFGKGIDGFLDLIDPNHSLNSIDYYVEPSENTIDKLAWILLREKKILCVRSKGKSLFYLPGGKRDKGESDLKALSREIKEELQVILEPHSFQFIRVFEAQADSKPPGVLVRMTCYEATYQGVLQIDSEIEEMAWLGYYDREKVSEVCRVIFDHLKSEDRM